MLLIIGLALIAYGYISFKFSTKRKFGNQGTNKNNYSPDWFPQLQRIGGILCIIIGLLLSITYFIF